MVVLGIGGFSGLFCNAPGQNEVPDLQRLRDEGSVASTAVHWPTASKVA
jgi:hypothetical protein